jgi:MFS family permease
MISNVAIGMAIGSFLTLLVPPFITDVTGSAARVGIVFALISLAATVGPWFGGRADRSGRHRRYYQIAMIAVSGSFAPAGPLPRPRPAGPRCSASSSAPPTRCRARLVRPSSSAPAFPTLTLPGN